MTIPEILSKLVEKISGEVSHVDSMEYEARGQDVEIDCEIDHKHYLITVKVQEYTPLSRYFETTERYHLFKESLQEDDWNKRIQNNPALTDFIMENYCYNHLTAKQLSRISGIPQPTLFARIKHFKFKPVYPEMKKSERTKKLDKDLKEIQKDPKPKLPISKKAATKKKWKKKK